MVAMMEVVMIAVVVRARRRLEIRGCDASRDRQYGLSQHTITARSSTIRNIFIILHGIKNKLMGILISGTFDYYNLVKTAEIRRLIVLLTELYALLVFLYGVAFGCLSTIQWMRNPVRQCKSSKGI
ncbi:hypothetical protein ASPWEDRAFT_412377 [Aspergillus wentii DTO 134E9]|uniref:Uncharacterized protein n=1 Tax=Aspergillus wentii DTO 134E9 TaxID=1073089 RepID=A0A1L9RNW4_ASPWE|nr:uncharacterized protein ASPWEDRAFT_412377 [Aspergillus wentii DTO 134E9]OJJ36563.1 hypothetical protein ASPWEDRAFT_412377 [Aspergillus wentii DTO 134E9]